MSIREGVHANKTVPDRFVGRKRPYPVFMKNVETFFTKAVQTVLVTVTAQKCSDIK